MGHPSYWVAEAAAEDMECDWKETGVAPERPLFENGEWAVTEAGLEHERNGYFIEREDLGRKRPDGLWIWPMHMLEKTWCSREAFAEAFMRAVLAYGIEADPELELSFQAAARAQAERGMWDRIAREFGLREPAHMPIGLGELAEIGAELCRRTEAWHSAARRRAGPAERLRQHVKNCGSEGAAAYENAWAEPI